MCVRVIIWNIKKEPNVLILNKLESKGRNLCLMPQSRELQPRIKMNKSERERERAGFELSLTS